MSLSHIDFLRHIQDEAKFILDNTDGISQQDFNTDEVLSRAVIRSLEIIGEACKKLPPDFRVSNPQIDWREIAGTRDKLIHDYFGVDYDIVWDIIISELPDLLGEIKNIISREENAL